MAYTSYGGLADGLVPQPVATEILHRAAEQSVVRRLAGTIPMPLSGAAIAVQTGHIEAGVVGEAAKKPVGDTSYGVKTITPIKVAAIAVVSNELIMANPAGIWDNISGDIADAITRAFDLAILHGKSAKTGAAIGGSHEFINQTANRVELGTATAVEGGLTADIIAGYNLVANGDQVFNGFNGIAADPRLRGSLLGSVDVNGRPVFQTTANLNDPVDTLLGVPTVYGRAVSGQIGASVDTDVRAFGGDWGAIKYGFAENLTVSVSKEANVEDGASTYLLWQQNMTAILAEAIFGWAIVDVDSFVAYDDAVPPAVGGGARTTTTAKSSSK